MNLIVKCNNRSVGYSLSKTNIHIWYSYQIRRRTDMKYILNTIKAEAKKHGFNYKRSVNSWIREWRAHNYLYDKGIELSRTAHVDLNEEEGFFRKLTYACISLMYKG